MFSKMNLLICYVAPDVASIRVVTQWSVINHDYARGTELRTAKVIGV